jgi:hypothetical protein
VEIGGELGGESFDVLLNTGKFVSPLALALRDWLDVEQFSNPVLMRNIRREGRRL